MAIVNRIAEFHPEITSWRHDLHAHPELDFDVHRTAASVAEKLKAFGCDEVVPGIGRTGVVGVIKGRKPANGGRAKVIGLRADMDALPIEEANDLPYKSTIPGKMHACGHDGHTAMLLGAAKYLAETRNFGGTAVVIFQPAEEGGGGGKLMVADGMMERFGMQEGEALEHKWLNRSVETAQKRVEQRNYTWRKRVLDFDDVMNKQREVVYDYRNEVLSTETPRALIYEIIDEVIPAKVSEFIENTEEGTPDYSGLLNWVHSTMPIRVSEEDIASYEGDSSQIAQHAVPSAVR